MKKLICLMISIVIYTNVNPQGFTMSKRFGGANADYSSRIHTDKFGNHFVAGFFASDTLTIGNTTLINYGDTAVFIAKFDPDWNPLWAKSGESSGIDYGMGCTTDNDGNCYFVGCFYSDFIQFGDFLLYNTPTAIPFHSVSDIFIVKYDVNGNAIWAKRFGGTDVDKACDVEVNDNSEIIITGWFYSENINFGSEDLFNSSQNLPEIFVAKFQNDGNCIWQKSVVGTYSDEPTSLDIDAIGNIYIAGWFTSENLDFGNNISISGEGGFMHQRDMFLAKYDSLGNTVWAKAAVGDNYDIALDVKADPSGQFIYVVGSFNSETISFETTTLNSSGEFDAFIASYGSSGQLNWVKQSDGTNSESATCVSIGENGSAYVGGNFKSYFLIFGSDTLLNKSIPDPDHTGYCSDIFMVKYERTGGIHYAQSAGGDSNEYLFDIQFIDDAATKDACWLAGVFFGTLNMNPGTTLISNGERDLFIAKSDVNILSGSLYWDRDHNFAYTNNEPLVPNKIGIIKHGGDDNLYFMSDANGDYRTPILDKGPYQLFLPDVPVNCKPIPDTIRVNISGYGQVSDENLGMDTLNLISGLIFNDFNKNGVREPGELCLTNATGKVSPGDYIFESDISGSYKVYVDTGTYLIKTDTVPGGTATPYRRTVSFNKYGQTSLNNDFGIGPANTISGKVFADNNQNGLKDENEKAVNNILIKLEQSGQPYKSCLTDIFGHFSFTAGLGDYRVTLQKANCFLPTSRKYDITFSTFGTNDTTNDFAIIPYNVLKGIAFNDRNNNHIKEPGEEVVAGCKVRLSPGSYEAVTGADGKYAISCIDKGVFQIIITPPACYASTPVNNYQTTDYGKVDSINIPLFKFNRIGGFAFDDKNKNNIMDLSETGIGNVKISLSPGNLMATTDNNGYYEIYCVDSIRYNVTLTVPDCYYYENQNTVIHLKSYNITELTHNIPLLLFNIIQGHVFLDNNCNETMDADDVFLPLVEIILLPQQKTTITDASGYFEFNCLEQGTYTVNAVAPQFHFFQTETASITFSSNGNINTNSAFAAMKLNFTSGKMYEDANRNHQLDEGEEGIRGFIRVLPKNDVYISAFNGNYRVYLSEGDYTLKPDSTPYFGIFPRTISASFTGCNDGLTGKDFAFVDIVNKLSGKVYRDANQNGQIDPEEERISNFWVKITNENSGITQLYRTNSIGRYLADLDTGCYRIEPILSSLQTSIPAFYSHICFTTYYNDTQLFDFGIHDKSNLISGYAWVDTDLTSLIDTLKEQVVLQFINTTYHDTTYCLSDAKGIFEHRVGLGDFVFKPTPLKCDTIIPPTLTCSFTDNFQTCQNNIFRIVDTSSGKITVDLISGQPNLGYWVQDEYFSNGWEYGWFSGIMYHIVYKNIRHKVVKPTIIFKYNMKDDVLWPGLMGEYGDLANNPYPDFSSPFYPNSSGICEIRNATHQYFTSTLIHTNETKFINIHPHENWGCAVPGDTSYCRASLYYNESLLDFSDDKRIFMGSWDPNDKQVLPSGDLTTEQIADTIPLTYTIRFQNTGNDTCHNALILDTLNKNLDVSSFEMVAASHNYKLTLSGHGILQWEFNNINLPDSNINYELSQGFIRYRISPKTWISIGDSICNRANIFFDYNLAVLTNTVVTKIKGSHSTDFINEKPDELLRIYPNPFTSKTKIILPANDNSPFSLFIYDQVGRLVDKRIGIYTSEIEYRNNNLNRGIYFVIARDALNRAIGNGKMLIM